MVAYFHKVRGGKFELTIMEKPENGEAFQKAEKIEVSGKREANKICKDRNIKPCNF